MKNVLLALAALFVAAAAVSPAQASGHHHDCHKVREHHHWVQHCR